MSFRQQNLTYRMYGNCTHALPMENKSNNCLVLDDIIIISIQKHMPPTFYTNRRLSKGIQMKILNAKIISGILYLHVC
jgi:hypothetical protein